MSSILYIRVDNNLTHISHIRSVAGVSAQQTVQQIMIRPTLTNNTQTSASPTSQHICSRSCSATTLPEQFYSSEQKNKNFTFWNMKRDGNVREMSSLITSRLDSRSATDVPLSTVTTQLTQHWFTKTLGCSGLLVWLYIRKRQTVWFQITARLSDAPPALLGSREEDLVKIWEKSKRVCLINDLFTVYCS